MLIKPCARCQKLIPYPTTYCEHCEPIVLKEKEERQTEARRRGQAAYNRKRNPIYSRFYASPEWRRLSRAKMLDVNYKCEKCGGYATEVHHIYPIQTPDGWEQRLAWPNLQAVCLNCHNQIHNRFKRKNSIVLK